MIDIKNFKIAELEYLLSVDIQKELDSRKKSISYEIGQCFINNNECSLIKVNKLEHGLVYCQEIIWRPDYVYIGYYDYSAIEIERDFKPFDKYKFEKIYNVVKEAETVKDQIDTKTAKTVKEWLKE